MEPLNKLGSSHNHNGDKHCVTTLIMAAHETTSDVVNQEFIVIAGELKIET